MSLLSCPECRHAVSDKAIACPGCGYPMSGSSVTTALVTAASQNKRRPSVPAENFPTASVPSKN